MTIMITAEGATLDSPASTRFGRAPYFLYIDADTATVKEAVGNTHAQDGHGVGIAAASAVLARAPDAVISGSFGPKAHEVLRQGEVDLYVLAGSTVRDVLAKFVSGSLERFTGRDSA